MARMDIAGQEQPTRLGGGSHQLDLGQVGPVILTVAQLHQALVVDGVVAIGGGGVEADPLHRRQVIDLALGAEEGGLQLVPGRLVAEAFEDQGQAVIAEIDRANGLADEGFQGVSEAVDPLLDVGLAVIALGEDVGDPDGDQPAVGESLVEGVWWDDAVDGLGDTESDQEADQQWDIIDALVDQIRGGAAGVLRRSGGAVEGSCVSGIPGDNHGRSPKDSEWRAGLYRSGDPEWKIQGKEREHGNDG